MTIHPLSHSKPCTHTLCGGKKKSVDKYSKTTTSHKWISSLVHIVGLLMVFGISHKTILSQQMHSAVHIIIIHLNIIHVLARHTEPNMCSWIFPHHRREALFIKRICSYIHNIHNTLRMHLFAVFLPLILSLLFSHVGGSAGHQAMPHQYAYWWNASPAPPLCAAVAEACSSGSSG